MVNLINWKLKEGREITKLACQSKWFRIWCQITVSAWVLSSPHAASVLSSKCIAFSYHLFLFPIVLLLSLPEESSFIATKFQPFFFSLLKAFCYHASPPDDLLFPELFSVLNTHLQLGIYFWTKFSFYMFIAHLCYELWTLVGYIIVSSPIFAPLYALDIAHVHQIVLDNLITLEGRAF